MSDEAYVTLGYFAVLQIPLLSGRAFTESDGANTQPVAIVNQSFVLKAFHGQNPVGRHLNKNQVIVGVVRDVAMVPGLDTYHLPLSTEETMSIPAAPSD